MVRVYDIVICPVCGGKGTTDGGQMMKDNRVYQVTKPCTECSGKGKLGKERREESNG